MNICDRCELQYCSYEPHSEECQSARIFQIVNLTLENSGYKIKRYNKESVVIMEE